eukprot:3678305-Lingulodinium_polyedra.AAC.1
MRVRVPSYDFGGPHRGTEAGVELLLNLSRPHLTFRECRPILLLPSLWLLGRQFEFRRGRADSSRQA